MSWNDTKLKALAVIPKFWGSLSFISSSFVLRSTVLSLQQKSPSARTTDSSHVYQRLLLGLSINSVVASTMSIMGSWMVPSETEVLWAVGNEKTCKMQGFVFQFTGMMGALYNFGLSWYYLMVIKYNWRDGRLRKWEPLLHTIPWSWGLGSALAGLFLDAYHPAGLWCWVGTGEGEISMKYAKQLRYILVYGPLFVILTIVSVNCAMVYAHVRKLEKASAKYHFSDHDNSRWSTEASPPRARTASERRKKKKSRQLTQLVALQCFLYAGAFWLHRLPLAVRKTKDTYPCSL